MSLSWSVAIWVITMTRPTVIIVTSTQPGTSPRSSRSFGLARASRASVPPQKAHPHGLHRVPFVESSGGREREADDARARRRTARSPAAPGRRPGTIISTSLRAATSISSRRPASRTSAAWACSTSASGVPRSTRDRDALREAGHQRQPAGRGHPVERRRRPARRCGPRRAPGPGRRTARRRCGGPPGPARRPGSPRRRPRAPAARRRSGTRRGSAARGVFTWLVRWLSRASTPSTKREQAQQHRGEHVPRVAQRAEHAERRRRARTRPAPTGPARSGTRARSCRGRPARSRRRTEAAPPSTRSTVSAADAQHRPEDADRGGHRGRRARRGVVGADRPTWGRSRT